MALHATNNIMYADFIVGRLNEKIDFDTEKNVGSVGLKKQHLRAHTYIDIHTLTLV